MKRTPKRVLSGLVAFAATVALAPALTPGVASAAGTLQGEPEVRSAGGAAVISSGNSSTAFTLSLPPGAACEGDSPNDGYRVQSYMVPASVDPATLTFDLAGPIPAGVGSDFNQPLFTTAGSGYANAQTAAATVPGGPGPIINIPNFDYEEFSPGHILPGAYNIGIACTLGPAGPDQLTSYWNTTKTFTTDVGGGPAQVSWSVGAVPAAPTLDTVTPDDESLAVAFTPIASSPATTGYTATATPVGGGAAVTETGAGSPITISDLVNGTTYDVTVRATNSVGDSAESNVLQGTPNPAARPAVQGLQAVPGTGTVTLSWSAPTGPTPTGYEVTVDPADAGPFTLDPSDSSLLVSGLTPGTSYTFTVTPTHPAPYVGSPATATAAPFDEQVLVQEITVTRPVGALVFTQVCGAHGAIPADTAGTPGFPDGSLPALPASGPGTAPTLTLGGSDQDPQFDEYPYPEDADGIPTPSYPTHCGVDLGNAKLVKSGPGAGQFFAASGVLNQVTVVDTRDTDIGWTANGTMSDFNAGPGRTFSGSQLGWTPVLTSDTDAFTDSEGVTYDQVVTAGDEVLPNTVVASGLSSGRALGYAEAGEGLGIGVLDARLKLLIPVTALSGDYTATLTISAA